MAEIKTIYVRGANWIGDAVMTIPALRELRRIFPAARITLHTRDWAHGIFDEATFFDEILSFQKSQSKIKTAFALSKIIREKKFDLAVLFPNSFETALVAKLGGIPRRFGYAKDARAFLLTDAPEIPEWKTERHEVFYYLNLIAEIEKRFFGSETVAAQKPNADLEVSGERKARARKFLTENSVDPAKKTVALGVGSTNSRAKRWHAASYAKLNDKLQSELNANVILVGAHDETDVANEVYDKSERKPVILTGKTDLAAATAILSVVDLLVSNDMGLAHIAAATKTDALVIFGPTNPTTTRPWNAEIIRKPVECAPCMLRDCPIDHRCMTGISPDKKFSHKPPQNCYSNKPTMKADGKKQKAAFIDRDGTLIEEVNFLSRLEDLQIFYTGEAIRLLKKHGFLIVVVTNQSGVARQIFEESAMHAIHAQIQSDLTLDAFYFCPHLPTDGCRCRKPNTGMIEAAQRDFSIDLENSWMIGDKTIDVETGFNAGIKTALVLTGYGRKAQTELKRKPDVMAENLLEAVKSITNYELPITN